MSSCISVAEEDGGVRGGAEVAAHLRDQGEGGLLPQNQSGIRIINKDNNIYNKSWMKRLIEESPITTLRIVGKIIMCCFIRLVFTIFIVW